MAAKSQKFFRRWYTRLVLVSTVWLSSWLLRGLFLTLRPIYVQRHFEHCVKDSGQPALLAIWHGRLLYFVHLYRHMAATVLVSRSKDGELISRILTHFGLHTTRGSSSRGGGQGLLQMVKRVHQGYHGAFTPDGPRGPRYQVQPGVVTAAQKTGAPILPAVYNAKWKRVLQSWDRFVIPLPFSRVVVVYGKPIYVPATASATIFQDKRQEVEASLQRITQIADSYF